MSKRFIIYCVLGLVLALGGYVYFGMFWAKNANETTNSQPTEEIDIQTRLQNAGSMTEEKRLEMIERLENAE